MQKTCFPPPPGTVSFLFHQVFLSACSLERKASLGVLSKLLLSYKHKAVIITDPKRKADKRETERSGARNRKAWI